MQNILRKKSFICFFHRFFQCFLKYLFRVTKSLLRFTKRIWSCWSWRFSPNISHPHPSFCWHFFRFVIFICIKYWCYCWPLYWCWFYSGFLRNKVSNIWCKIKNTLLHPEIVHSLYLLTDVDPNFICMPFFCSAAFFFPNPNVSFCFFASLWLKLVASRSSDLSGERSLPLSSPLESSAL